MMIPIGNRSQWTFSGWLRINCDPVPPHRVGVAQASDGTLVHYRVGRTTGRESRGVDFLIENLPPGEVLHVDIEDSKHSDEPAPALPPDLMAWFGGAPTLGGVPFAFMGAEVDGAGFRSTWLMRFGNSFGAELWTHWIPGQPWCCAELRIVSTNLATTQMTELLAPGLALAFGDAIVLVPGLDASPNGSTIISFGEDVIADGQGKATLPVLFGWARHLGSDPGAQVHAFAALAERGVSGIGIETLWPLLGNPRLPADFNAQSWRNARLSESVRRLHTWERAVVGPNPRSGDTGAQEDQIFKGGECYGPDGVGAEEISVLGAYKLTSRPCHFMEASLAIVDFDVHSQAAIWAGRPYFHVPDKLGKERGLSTWETHGWEGPDDEHNMHNRLFAACRLRDSDALQKELAHQAHNYLGMYRVEPASLPYLSIPFSARSTLYEGLLVHHLYEALMDRDLAARVLRRAFERVLKVIVPAYVNLADDVWDWRRDDRIGPGWRWMPWQQACGSFGLDLMSEILKLPEGRKVALRAALAVLRDAFVKVGGYWTTKDVVPADPAEVPFGAYDWFGNPMAIATILRNLPTHGQAREVWNQYLTHAVSERDLAWLVPGIEGSKKTCRITSARLHEFVAANGGAVPRAQRGQP